MAGISKESKQMPKLQYIVVFPDGTTWSALENCKIVGITPEQADQLGDESRTVVDLVAPSCDITEMIDSDTIDEMLDMADDLEEGEDYDD